MYCRLYPRPCLDPGKTFNLGVQGSNPCGLTSKAITWSLKKSPARKFGQYAPNGHSAGQI